MRPFTLLQPPGGRRLTGPRASTASGRWRSNRRRPVRILLASGNANERLSWRGILADPNYVLSEVDNGAAALKIMLLGEADLVIAAVSMARLDALELLRAARDIKQAPPIVVVALGHSEINQVYLKTAKLLGAIATFMQPFDADDFASGIQTVLTLKRER